MMADPNYSGAFLLPQWRLVTAKSTFFGDIGTQFNRVIHESSETTSIGRSDPSADLRCEQPGPAEWHNPYLVG